MGTTKIATLLRDFPANGVGAHWKHYRLNPPLRDPDAVSKRPYEYVIVSATVVVGPETYIFGADENGQVVAWGELRGSFHGGLDHERALRGAGYEVTGKAAR